MSRGGVALDPGETERRTVPGYERELAQGRLRLPPRSRAWGSPRHFGQAGLITPPRPSQGRAGIDTSG